MVTASTLARARAGDQLAPVRVGELTECLLIARPYGMIVLTLRGDQISAITWFSDSSVFPHFGLPRVLPR